MDRDYRHPERHIEDMVFFPKGEIHHDKFHDAKQKARFNETTIFPRAESLDVELCRSCGWTARHECHSSYISRVRVMHTTKHKGFWSLEGSSWILIDQPNDPETLGNDFMTQEFLRSQPNCNIPLLKEMTCISKPTDQTRFILMSRAEGVTLRSVWSNLSVDEKLSYSRQMADILKELRTYTAPAPQKVDGTPLDDTIIGLCLPFYVPFCKKIGADGKAWIDNLADELRRGLAIADDINDPAIIEEKFQDLRERFPNQEPYVLSHLDLHPGNIMVKDGKIDAILDWEFAGYYPFWVEHYRNYIIHDPDKKELFDPVWEYEPSLVGCMDQSQRETYMDAIEEAMLLYKLCPIDHPNHEGYWRRPPFCKCKDFGGRIRTRFLGKASGHRVDGEGNEPHRARRERGWLQRMGLWS